MNPQLSNLIDIGANLTHSAFEHDFENVITESVSAGLSHIILTGTDLHSSTEATNLARQRPNFFSSTAGFHPHVSEDVTAADFDHLQTLLTNPEVVAIGETGLDFNRNYSPPDKQRQVFETHLELACTVHKPLFLHQRDAHTDFYSMLCAYREHIPGGVVHCFTDSRQALRDYLDLDMHIGITGWVCDERRGRALQDIVRYIPHDRLLIETDAPYLLPRTLRPKPKSRRNEPKHLTEVLSVLAACRKEDAGWLGLTTSNNARSLFQLDSKALTPAAEVTTS